MRMVDVWGVVRGVLGVQVVVAAAALAVMVMGLIAVRKAWIGGGIIASGVMVTAMGVVVAGAV